MEYNCYCCLSRVESLRGRIPKCYGSDRAKRALYLQRIYSPTLRQAPPDESTFLGIKEDLLKTITIIHEHGWCHGDINLGNIFAQGMLFDFSHANPKSKLSAQAWEDFKKEDVRNIQRCHGQIMRLEVCSKLRITIVEAHVLYRT